MTRLLRKIKCFVGRHKYAFMTSFYAGGNNKGYLTCDWCDRIFFKITHIEKEGFAIRK